MDGGVARVIAARDAAHIRAVAAAAEQVASV